MLTKTPFMAKRELYKISGHWDHYRDGMFIWAIPQSSMIERGDTCAAPDDLPVPVQVYLSRLRSYRELPSG